MATDHPRQFLLRPLLRLGVLAVIAIFLSWMVPSQAVMAAQHAPVHGAQAHGAQVLLSRQDGSYRLWLNDRHDLQVDIDPRHGARITAFRLDHKNILTPSSTDSQNYGSTFWPSPQTDWEWPPIAEIDSEPYTVQVGDSTLVMTSKLSPDLGVQVTKTFSADVQRSKFSVEYTLTNLSDHPQAFAPWEISRVHPHGLTFYPTGNATLGSGPFDRLLTQNVNGITWFEYDSQAIETNQKLYADGAEGWLAHVDGDQLLIKSFEDIPLERQAPTEGEIEIFANASSPYIEIEQQGPYTQISPQASFAWTVDWYLCKLPSNLSPTVGNESLVQFVRDRMAF